MTNTAPDLKPAEGWLAGGGEMGALIRSFDWSQDRHRPDRDLVAGAADDGRLHARQSLPAAALVGAGIHLHLQRPLPAGAGDQTPLGPGQAGARMLERDLAHPQAADRNALQWRARDLDGGHRARDQPPRFRGRDPLHHRVQPGPRRDRPARHRRGARHRPRDQRQGRQRAAGGRAARARRGGRARRRRRRKRAPAPPPRWRGTARICRSR